MPPFWEMYVFVWPQQPLTDVVVAAVGAAYCVLGIWATRSRRHWSIRASAVLAALSLFVFIEAYEPLVLFALTIGFLLFGKFVEWRWSSTRDRIKDKTETPPTSTRTRWQFQLHDLLLSTVVVGVVLWFILRTIDYGLAIRDWWKPPLAAFQLTLVSSTAIGVLHARRDWLTIASFVVLVFAAAMNDLLIVGDWLGLESGYFRVLPDHLLAYAVFAALCGAFWLAADASRWLPSETLKSRAGTATAAVLSAAALLLLGWVYWRMLDYGSDKPPNPTGPNSLPRVLALAEELQLVKGTPSKAQPIYDGLLVRLAEPGYVKVDWEQVQQDGGFEVGQVGPYRQLARDLKAEAERLASAGEPDRAAALGVACAQLGDRLTNDSGAFYGLVGRAVASMGQIEIAKLRHDLPAETRQKVLRQLQTLQSESYEPFDQIWLEETRIAQLFGWTHRFDVLMSQDLWSGQDRQSREQFEKAYLRHQVQVSLLLAELAILCHRDDQGAWPDRLDELVPDYLPEVPLDPLSGQPLVYRVTGDNYVLYSIGTDRQDNGGKFGDATAFNNAWFTPEPGLDFDLNGLWK